MERGGLSHVGLELRELSPHHERVETRTQKLPVSPAEA